MSAEFLPEPGKDIKPTAGEFFSGLIKPLLYEI
jgi:hypothetical protein